MQGKQASSGQGSREGCSITVRAQYSTPTSEEGQEVATWAEFWRVHLGMDTGRDLVTWPMIAPWTALLEVPTSQTWGRPVVPRVQEAVA